jgi:hypothetical protein
MGKLFSKIAFYEMLVGLYETQMIGSSNITDLECDFAKIDVKEFILRIKKTKPQAMTRSQPSYESYFAPGGK